MTHEQSFRAVAERAPMTVSTTQDRLSAQVGGDRLMRGALFLAAFLLLWFGTAPFPDLGDPTLLEPTAQGNLFNQTATMLLTAALAAFVLLKPNPLLRRAVTLPLILTLAAFAVSALLSAYPEVAGRRLVLAVFTIFQATAFLLLPCGREHFARLLAVAAIIVLAACYFGVVFMPKLSIHQISDIAEPELAGDWRGLFAHKNAAGAAMDLLIFIAIFVYRTGSRLAGIAIVAAAGVFLFFTHAKSALNLLPLILVLSYCIARTRNAALILLLVAGVPVIINLLTVGSVMFVPIQNLVDAWLPDPSYTGRTEIWRFALDRVAQRPLFGFGFEAFWGMPDLVAQWTRLESWGYRASDAHNGYLNLAVTTGLVGLALALWWIIARPMADYRRARALGADPALLSLFLQIWTFGLCDSGFGSELFGGGSKLWFFMVASIIGFRFLTIAKSSK